MENNWRTPPGHLSVDYAHEEDMGSLRRAIQKATGQPVDPDPRAVCHRQLLRRAVRPAVLHSGIRHLHLHRSDHGHGGRRTSRSTSPQRFFTKMKAAASHPGRRRLLVFRFFENFSDLLQTFNKEDILLPVL